MAESREPSEWPRSVCNAAAPSARRTQGTATGTQLQKNSDSIRDWDSFLVFMYRYIREYTGEPTIKSPIPYLEWDRCFFIFAVAGLSNSSPSAVKRDPWHGQSQDRSCRFHCKVQPRWGHRGFVSLSKFFVVSSPLINSCLRTMVLAGEKISA